MAEELHLENVEEPKTGEASTSDATATEATQEPAVAEVIQELAPERQYCVFRAGRERYCMSVLDIEEVVEWPKITPLPRSPEFLLGIFNLRGAIVPVVDVAFHQNKRTDSLLRRVVVGLVPPAESHGFVRIGIAADEVTGTFTTVEPLATDDIPAEVPHCSGLLRMGESVAMALDLKRVTEVFPVPVI